MTIKKPPDEATSYRPSERPLALLLAGDEALRGALRGWLDVHFPYGRVLEAGTGPEAMRLVEEWLPETAVVILSHSLAEGINVVRTLKEALPSLQIMAISPHDAPEYQAEVEAAGAYAFIPAQQISVDLIPAIERSLTRQSGGEKGE